MTVPGSAESATPRRPGRGSYGVSEQYRILGEPVDIRRGIPGVAVTAYVVGPQCVYYYQDDVRASSFGGRHTGKCEQQYKNNQ